jgi:hypothetical protein
VAVLLVCLPQSLVVLLSFLLEELHPSLKGLVLSVVLEALAGSILGLLQGGLGLLNLFLEQLVAVVKGCDLLFLGQVLLFQRLHSGLELVDLLVSLIGLGAEGDHALIKDILAGFPV